MRDFTWRVFTQTGDIEAYLLYREMNAAGPDRGLPADGVEDEEAGSAGADFGMRGADK